LDGENARRIHLVAGDFFRPFPQAVTRAFRKTYFTDWNDDRACDILAACGRVISTGGGPDVVEASPRE
jgi:hypothetical protein